MATASVGRLSQSSGFYLVADFSEITALVRYDIPGLVDTGIMALRN